MLNQVKENHPKIIFFIGYVWLFVWFMAPEEKDWSSQEYSCPTVKLKMAFSYAH